MSRYSTTDPETGLPARKSLYGRTEQEERAKLLGCRVGNARRQLADGTAGQDVPISSAELCVA
jgi:hypothetical protein